MIYELREDPLDTQVILNDWEKKIFRQLIIKNYWEETLFDIYFKHEHKQSISIEEAAKLSIDAMSLEDQEIDIQVFINDLNSGHAGDCTCAPFSCIKCHFESMLEISTLPSEDKFVNGAIWHLYKGEKSNNQEAIRLYEKHKSNYLRQRQHASNSN